MTDTKPKKKKVQVTMSDELFQVINEKATTAGISLSGVICYMLMESVKLEKNMNLVEQFMEMARKQESASDAE